MTRSKSPFKDNWHAETATAIPGKRMKKAKLKTINATDRAVAATARQIADDLRLEFGTRSRGDRFAGVSKKRKLRADECKVLDEMDARIDAGIERRLRALIKKLGK